MQMLMTSLPNLFNPTICIQTCVHVCLRIISRSKKRIYVIVELITTVAYPQHGSHSSGHQASAWKARLFQTVQLVHDIVEVAAVKAFNQDLLLFEKIESCPVPR